MQIDFGGVMEDIVTRKEFPLKKAQKILKGKTIAVIGYGVQGPAQALNMRDNGANVIIGMRKSSNNWKRAIKDGWKPGVTLFEIAEAAKRGDIVMMLNSDASMKPVWKTIKPFMTAGKALYFSHGFGYVYNDITGIKAPKDVDVIMVAPKGSGLNVRRNFLNGAGINSSFAVEQDATGHALELTLALGIVIGSGYIFPTTFKKEVTSDLTGERVILMGALQGVMSAQYKTLRAHGHSPSEAFNETIEELTQSLIRLVDEKGMDWMFSNCSVTAQRGALDWAPRFEKATKPVFEQLYKAVESEAEARRVTRLGSRPDYKERLDAELKEMRESEMWRAGAAVRSLRPHEKVRQGADKAAGITGRANN
ncbi:MAG: ketol-acid reductoisomerase [Kiritimatiellae bacterium]|nr:ketol-acid reductoisomerase [Kiritimatiellia bacterium]